jgi:hypothetical protein
VKIAKNHGFANWREIYNHADNKAFAAKRPKSRQDLPGGALIIPGRPPNLEPPPLPHCAGGVAGGSFGFARMPLLLNLRGSRSSDLDRARAPGKNG